MKTKPSDTVSLTQCLWFCFFFSPSVFQPHPRDACSQFSCVIGILPISHALRAHNMCSKMSPGHKNIRNLIQLFRLLLLFLLLRALLVFWLPVSVFSVCSSNPNKHQAVRVCICVYVCVCEAQSTRFMGIHRGCTCVFSNCFPSELCRDRR